MTTQTDWAVFEGRLAQTLRNLPDRVFLAIEAADNGDFYLQFIGSAYGAHIAEACAVAVPGDSQTMQEAGWDPPADSPNWSIAIDNPSDSALASMAKSCVTALATEMHVSSPDQLAYNAWREAERKPLFSRREWDRGADFHELPELGLRERR